MRKQNAFTLIELLVVIAIIGVLGRLGLTSFYLYRADAAYANVQRAVHEISNAASAGTLDSDNLPAAVPLTVATTPGPLPSAAQNFLVGFQLSKNMSLSVSYDPACTTTSCVSGFAQIKHCSGKQYMQWFLYGDGSYETIENIDGAGCV